MTRLLALLSGSDARTALIAISAAAGVLTYLGLAVWSFARGAAAFDGTAFAGGWGLTLGASAAAMAGHSWGQAKADAIPAASAPPVAVAAPVVGGGS